MRSILNASIDPDVARDFDRYVDKNGGRGRRSIFVEQAIRLFLDAMKAKKAEKKAATV